MLKFYLLHVCFSHHFILLLFETSFISIFHIQNQVSIILFSKFFLFICDASFVFSSLYEHVKIKFIILKMKYIPKLKSVKEKNYLKNY